MTTPEDAKDLFAEAQAAFTPVVGAPNDENVKRLNEAFINALQSIDVPDGAVDMSDILLTDEDHKAKHGGDKTVKCMEVTLQAYDDSIAADANNAVLPRPNVSGRKNRVATPDQDGRACRARVPRRRRRKHLAPPAQGGVHLL